MNGKWIDFSTSLDTSDFFDYSGIKQQITNVRNTICSIMEGKLGAIQSGIIDEWLMGTQNNWVEWSSSYLPVYPKEEEGKVALLYFCEERTEHEVTGEKATLHLLQVAYFYNANPKKGFTEDYDFYYFKGYSKAELRKVISTICERYKLENVSYQNELS